jgi:hypothetical protein
MARELLGAENLPYRQEKQMWFKIQIEREFFLLSLLKHHYDSASSFFERILEATLHISLLLGTLDVAHQNKQVFLLGRIFVM